MKLLQDYLYRFPTGHLQVPGRCRVRIYRRKNGTHTVLLTELSTNRGEPITIACARIVTGLAAVKGLNPKTTRWIQHELPHDELPHVFDELRFTWDRNNTASDPQWQRLGTAQVEGLIGNSLGTLNRPLEDSGFQVKGRTEHAETEAERAT